MPPFGVASCAFTENQVSSVDNKSAMLPNNYFCSSTPEQSVNCSPTPAQSPPQPITVPQPDTLRSCDEVLGVNGNHSLVKHSYRIISPPLEENCSGEKVPSKGSNPIITKIKICREKVLVVDKPVVEPLENNTPANKKSNDDSEIISSSTAVECNTSSVEMYCVSGTPEPTSQVLINETSSVKNVKDMEYTRHNTSNEINSCAEEVGVVSSSSSISIQTEDSEKIVDDVSNYATQLKNNEETMKVTDIVSNEAVVHFKNDKELLILKDEGTNQVDSIPSKEIDTSNMCNEIILPATPLTEQKNKTDGCSPKISKVIVETIPVVDFANISALEEYISDKSLTKKSISYGESSSFKTGHEMKATGNVKVPNAQLGNSIKQSPSLPNILSNISPNKITKKRQFNQTDGILSSSYSVKRKQYLVIKPGSGIKLSNIEYIANAVRNADPSTLRILHFVMFNKYGIINDSSIEQTKKNILEFSGFSFKEAFDLERKRQCLLKLPRPLLYKVYRMLTGKSSIVVPLMTDELMNFLIKPEIDPKLNSITICAQDIFKVNEEVRKRILEGPFPIVRLERLNEDLVKRKLVCEAHLRSVKVGSMNNTKEHDPFYGYEKPYYILDGPGQKLISFPNVVTGVYKARRRIINLLHSFLFGKPGSEEANRLNILEFSGFPKYHKTYSNRRVAFLKKLKPSELKQMCEIFSISAKNTAKYMIKKLLQFLQAPSLVINRKYDESGILRMKKRGRKPKSSQIAKESIPDPPVRTKLRDFEKICFNIECAPPEELLELNDLLFLKPSDYTEIHEKILNFTPFSLVENSSELQIRKTLLHYMSFEIIRKMARLLDIPAWDQYRSRDDLALTTLKFLTDLKRPVDATKVRRKAKSETKEESKKEICSTGDVQYRPHILKVQKNDNFYFENDMNEYFSSPSSGRGDSITVSDGSDENSYRTDNSDILIQRISENTYTWTDLKTNNNLIFSNQASEEAMSLREFALHPSEDQLQLTIKDVICSNSWSITTGELLNKVLQRYPNFNLFYRSDFIKAKALEILQEVGAWGMDNKDDMD